MTTARTTTEFTTLISGCVADPSHLQALEVTQSIQDLDNSVPLVAYKDTVVRAYLTTTGEPQRVTGSLRGFRNGVELAGSPLTPVNARGVLVDGDYLSDRGSLSQTLNFELPDSWLAGTIGLALELPGGVTCATPGEGAIPCATAASFGEGLTYDVEYIGFYWNDDGVEVATTTAQLKEQHERAISLLPVGSDMRYNTRTVELLRPATKVNTALSALRVLQHINNSSAPKRWHGVLPGAHPGGTEGGRATGTVAASWLYNDDGQSWTGRGRNRVAHELGHTYGLHHTVKAEENGWKDIAWIIHTAKNGWCGEEASTRIPDWPYWMTTDEGDSRPTLSDLSSPRGQAWGMDTRFINTGGPLVLSDPSVVWPLMSYCDSEATNSQMRWITPSDYLHLLGDDLDPIGGWSDDTAEAEGADALLVRGLVDLATSTVTLDPALTTPGGFTASDPDGTHEIVVRDTEGDVLQAVTFTPELPEGDPADGAEATTTSEALITITIPRDLPGAATLEVRGEGETLFSTPFSAGAPEATIDVPTTGTAEDVTVTWSSSDPDADELSHTLLYSADDGTTWDVVSLDLDRTTTSIPRWGLPGSDQARFKVIVSDGLHASEAVTERFSLPNLAPTVTLEEPLDGTILTGAQSLALRAQAYDAEDGALDDASVTWVSDRDRLRRGHHVGQRRRARRAHQRGGTRAGNLRGRLPGTRDVAGRVQHPGHHPQHEHPDDRRVDAGLAAR